LVIIAIATLATTFLQSTWIIRKVEATNLGSFFLLAKGKPSGKVALVEISDEDYGKVFNSRSPLEQTKVAELVHAIDDAGALAIGVDIQSDHWRPETVQDLHTKAHVVWARSSETDKAKVIHAPILGEPDSGIDQGPPQFQFVDGIASTYPREVELQSGVHVPAFTTILRNLANPASKPEPAAPAHAQSPISYITTEFQVYSVREILDSAKDPEWARKRLMSGQVVLLGSAFKESRDSYLTPFGEMYGVEILANILDSELSNRTVLVAQHWWFILADLAFGFGLLVASYLLARRWAGWSLLVIFAGAPLAAAVMSYALFLGWPRCHLYLSFMPVTAGVLVHTVIEHIHEHRKLLSRFRALQGRCRRLQEEIREVVQPQAEAGPRHGVRKGQRPSGPLLARRRTGCPTVTNPRARTWRWCGRLGGATKSGQPAARVGNA
jgi:CHASE2 domain-containing sensor protein